MSKPKILILNWQDKTHPLAGGAEVYLHQIFGRLVEDFDITLVCSGYPGCQTQSKIDGIKVLRLGTKRCLTPLKTFLWYLLQGRKQNFDVVVEFVNKVPYLSPLYIHRPKRICLQHHFNGTTLLREKKILGKLLMLMEKLLFWFYRKEKFVVVSESTKEDMANYGLDVKRAQIIYNGLEPVKKIKLKKFTYPTLICISRLKKYKCIDLLIKAFALIKKEMPNATLLILGRGDQQENLRKLTCQLGISESVKFTGYVSEEEKHRLLGRSHLHVTTSMKEGWGIAVMEAAQQGLATVAFNVAGHRDAIHDGVSGVLVPFGDIDAFAKATLLLLSDESKLSKMGRMASKFAANFTWDSSANSFRELIARYCYGDFKKSAKEKTKSRAFSVAS